MFRWATASLMHKEDSVTPGAWRLPDKPSGTFETQRAGVLQQVCPHSPLANEKILS